MADCHFYCFFILLDGANKSMIFQLIVLKLILETDCFKRHFNGFERQPLVLVLYLRFLAGELSGRRHLTVYFSAINLLWQEICQNKAVGREFFLAFMELKAWKPLVLQQESTQLLYRDFQTSFKLYFELRFLLTFDSMMFVKNKLYQCSRNKLRKKLIIILKYLNISWKF